MATYRIASIPGDGIGHEVMPAARAVLDAAGSRHGVDARPTRSSTGRASATCARAR